MEQVLWRHGYTVVGVDEAGRGPLAGPVVAAAAMLPQGITLPGVNDSKQLSRLQREAAYERVCAAGVAFGVGVVDHARIDAVNILVATFEAMDQAIRNLLEKVGEEAPQPFLLLDGNGCHPDWKQCQRAVIKGDSKVTSIAAASIIAKVTRDRIMVAYDQVYPRYGFIRHKGYGSKEHMDALKKWGPCPIHRQTFIKHQQTNLF